jgi:hypothetical protein
MGFYPQFTCQKSAFAGPENYWDFRFNSLCLMTQIVQSEKKPSSERRRRCARAGSPQFPSYLRAGGLRILRGLIVSRIGAGRIVGKFCGFFAALVYALCSHEHKNIDL